MGHEENENTESDTEPIPRPDKIVNNEVKTESSDTTITDTAPLQNKCVTDSNDITKTNVTQEITCKHDPTFKQREQVQQKGKSELGNKKHKQRNQPKMKKISELKMLAKARRRIATVERRQAQKDYHYLT